MSGIKVRVNQRSISAKLEGAEEQIEEKFKDKLTDIALRVAISTPVDTGALASSWSVVPVGQRSGGRSASSRGRPRKQAPGPYVQLAYRNMTADINSLRSGGIKNVSFVNRAPHARYVGILNRVINPVKARYR